MFDEPMKVVKRDIHPKRKKFDCNIHEFKNNQITAPVYNDYK